MIRRQFLKAQRTPQALVIEIQQPVGSLAEDSVLKEFEELQEELHASGLKAVIVDFHQVSYFGSSLLEALRILWKDVQAVGGQMVLCNLSPVGREIIELAKFDHVWPIAESLDDAGRYLPSSPPN